MPQRDIGLILMRQLASGLAVPMLLADEHGDMLYFNEPAEVLLGNRFDELGEMPLEQRRRIFAFRNSTASHCRTTSRRSSSPCASSDRCTDSSGCAASTASIVSWRWLRSRCWAAAAT